MSSLTTCLYPCKLQTGFTFSSYSLGLMTFPLSNPLILFLLTLHTASLPLRC